MKELKDLFVAGELQKVAASMRGFCGRERGPLVCVAVVGPSHVIYGHSMNTFRLKASTRRNFPLSPSLFSFPHLSLLGKPRRAPHSPRLTLRSTTTNKLRAVRKRNRCEEAQPSRSADEQRRPSRGASRQSGSAARQRGHLEASLPDDHKPNRRCDAPKQQGALLSVTRRVSHTANGRRPGENERKLRRHNTARSVTARDVSRLNIEYWGAPEAWEARARAFQPAS